MRVVIRTVGLTTMAFMTAAIVHLSWRAVGDAKLCLVLPGLHACSGLVLKEPAGESSFAKAGLQPQVSLQQSGACYNVPQDTVSSSPKHPVLSILPPTCSS